MANSPREDRSVVVVGAGPVGLTAALALRNKGLRVVVLEKEPQGRLRPGSRAIFTHKASLQIFEQLSPGLGEMLAHEGIVWPVKRTYFRGREVYVKRYPAPDPRQLPPFSSLPQVTIERYLYEACVKQAVEFRWGTAVTGVVSEDEGVTLQTTDGLWKASYVIAADGARSAVRKGLGIDMEGSRSTNTFIVIDVSEDAAHPLPVERVFHYQHPKIGYRNVLYVPFAGGWRIDLQLFANDDVEYYGHAEGVREWLPRVMPQWYRDQVTWISSYQFLQVVAKQFIDSKRRVALVGEAAHLFAPFGARGMNSGVVDAAEAAMAIHRALAAATREESNACMDEFASRRHMAARYNCDAAAMALEHIQGRRGMIIAKRLLAAWIAPVWTQAGRWLDEGPYGPRSGPPQLTTKY